jgi:hypothetical protein
LNAPRRSEWMTNTCSAKLAANRNQLHHIIKLRERNPFLCRSLMRYKILGSLVAIKRIRPATKWAVCDLMLRIRYQRGAASEAGQRPAGERVHHNG